MFRAGLKTASSLLLLLLFPLLCFSQNKAQLEKEKLDNISKIKETEKIIEETKTQKNATLGQLNLINNELSARYNLITSIEQEIHIIDNEIVETEYIITAMENDLHELKEEYSKMIYITYKLNSNALDKLTFIFAAESFNQFVMRIRYFQQYAEVRQNQLDQIEKVKKTLTNQKIKLNRKRREKNALLSSKEVETDNLNHLKEEKSTVVTELTHKEKELKRELEETKKSIKKLDKLIADLVKKEMERAKREAEAKTGKKGVNVTPEVASISSSFAGNIHRLPWPVGHGSVSQHFGIQPHPVLPNVDIENLGVNILTLRNEPVKAVFPGKVMTVASVPGMNSVVMIQHGEYFTVYARLKPESIKVKTGDQVNAKEEIGEVYTDKNNISELQFQIWKNSDKLDPEEWLYTK